MSPIALAQSILRECWQQGVREIVLCAGARNAPFVHCLSGQSPFVVYSFFEERSAAFFALGRMQSSQRPVAVVTTSGTAAAELLPATIEADYQGLPLLLLTADRPTRYRGTGAPQTIQQPGLFSHYVEECVDLEGEGNSKLSQWTQRRPFHLNICFDEPLLEGHVEPWGKIVARPCEPSQFDKAKSQIHVHAGSQNSLTTSLRSPLVIVSGLTREQSEWIKPILKKWQRPIYIEATAQLRGDPTLAEYEILGSEKILRHLRFDGVIRIGHIPTLRFWRDLENSDWPVFNFSDLPFSGLPRVKTVYALTQVADFDTEFAPWQDEERAGDRHLAQRLNECLAQFPLSEPAWVQHLSDAMPAQARLLLGNSLPIREWDLAASRGTRCEVFANRGVNGIDGMVSTFCGLSESSRSNWSLLGDLTALYDLSGPWALRQRPISDWNLIVLNNAGGKIFERMFHNSLYENPHDLNFKAWAAMWNIEYTKIVLRENVAQLKSQGRPRIVEIQPDAEQTTEFWREWEKIR